MRQESRREKWRAAPQGSWAGAHVRRQSGEKPCHNKPTYWIGVRLGGMFREDLLIETDSVGRKSWLQSDDAGSK